MDIGYGEREREREREEGGKEGEMDAGYGYPTIRTLRTIRILDARFLEAGRRKPRDYLSARTRICASHTGTAQTRICCARTYLGTPHPSPRWARGAARIALRVPVPSNKRRNKRRNKWPLVVKKSVQCNKSFLAGPCLGRFQAAAFGRGPRACFRSASRLLWPRCPGSRHVWPGARK